MDYTFECGSCHAIYKLDENQITPKGVKITCPKCLSYFILKKGSGASTRLEAAYIEYVTEDGAVETTVSKLPKKKTTQFDKDEKTEKISTTDVTEIEKPPRKHAAVDKAKKEHYLDRKYVPPYRPPKRKKNKALPYILVFLVVATALWLLWKVL